MRFINMTRATIFKTHVEDACSRIVGLRTNLLQGCRNFSGVSGGWQRVPLCLGWLQCMPMLLQMQRSAHIVLHLQD
jgi:hypothetical protein